MPLLRLLLTLLRWILQIAPAGVTVALFRYSRNVFSIALNRELEEQLFATVLKGRPETLPLPRLVVPIATARTMKIRVGDESQRSYWFAAYDDVASYLLRHLRPEDTFIDVGANCGYVTLLASSIVPAERIWSFEPNPETFGELKANLAANGLAVNAHNLGLSDAAGRCQLFVPDGACGGSSIDAKNYRRRDLLPGETLPTRSHEIEVVRFDEFWTCARTPTDGEIVIKIDAEGHEFAILAGMKEFLRQNAGWVTLLVEIYESEYDAVTSALREFGLSPAVVELDGLTGSAERPARNRFRNYRFRTVRATGA